MLAGCDGSSHAAATTSTHAAATTTGPGTSAAPATLSLAQRRADYLSAVAVDNARSSKAQTAFNSLGSNATAAQYAAIARSQQRSIR